MIKEISNQEGWNTFLLKQNPNTFLQSWEWGQVQAQSRHTAHYLAIFDSEKQIGSCLTLTVPARRGIHILIPHGPVFSSENETRHYLPEIIEYCRGIAKHEHAVALRIEPQILMSKENITLFQKLGFRPAPMHVHAELTWVLDINKSEEEILSGMRKTTRHAIRKAEKSGVATEITTAPNAIDRFLPLYQETKQRHDFVPYSEATLRAQLELFSLEDRVFAVFARHQNQDIAAGIFFQFGNTVFYYHGASLKSSANVSAAQFLQWAAIREARRRGATQFNFWGIAPDDEPKHPFAGITTFKKGFGGRAIPYMHAQDLPLSIGYWKLWATDTYRKIKRGF